MPQSDLVIRLGGEGGEGVISASDMFTAGAARAGYDIFTFRTYPAEIKGGHAWYQIRIGQGKVGSLGDAPDILVCFNQEAYEIHAEHLRDGGVLVYDPAAVKPEVNGHNHQHYAVPMTAIAKQQDFVRGKNLILLGALCQLFGLEPSELEGVVRSRLARRAELLQKNLQSLQVGYDFAKENLTKQDPYFLPQIEKREGTLVMSGNEAIVAGALYAGVRFFAGYPITPASDIMEGMARELPKLGGLMLQAEDEMAAVSMVVGAAFGGVKAMTATSGPGYTLMAEVTGLSGMSEIPLIIIDAQRSGPSTGMPTKLEQSDLNHALFGGHGDFPRVVIAPGSVEDSFRQIVRAVNFAWKYQVPVIFLSDQSLSHRTESLQAPDLRTMPVYEREAPTTEELAGYARYKFTESGVSPMAIPGERGGMYVSAGLEHDEFGHPDLDADNHVAMTYKRYRKLDTLMAELEREPLPLHGDEDAEIALVSWGASEGAVLEAVDRANAKGIKTVSLHLRVLNPLPENQLRDFFSTKKKILVAEHNYSGQLARHLRGTLGISTINVNKFGGLPFTAGEILARIEEEARG
ncbi:MAG: 2-oxoacid:acceptor oxidoreductase subunit alpha [Dehalococcoidia bacterium]